MIFWYTQGLGLQYTLPGGEVGVDDQEWEMFDCEEDPMELFNVRAEPEYAEARERMIRLLESKMLDIGDVPAHPVGQSGKTLAAVYKPGANIAMKAQQQNLD